MARARIVNVEEGFPTRDQAIDKLQDALTRARKDGAVVLKIIHGYGSSGTGGILRYAVRSFLRQKKEKGELALFINGESFSSYDERSRALFKTAPDMLLDPDLGRGNKGITLVVL